MKCRHHEHLVMINLPWNETWFDEDVVNLTRNNFLSNLSNVCHICYQPQEQCFTWRNVIMTIFRKSKIIPVLVSSTVIV